MITYVNVFAGVENVPGTNVTWTDWAAAELNRGWGR